MDNSLITPASDKTVPTSKPRLWSPNAAANWSLLFSPAFGAILHAKNWIELGEIDRARSNKNWARGVLIFLATAVLIPSIPILDRIIQVVGLVLILRWYFTQGRQQVTFVKEKYGQEYERKKWGQPILIGIGCLVGFLACSIIINMIYALLFGLTIE